MTDPINTSGFGEYSGLSAHNCSSFCNGDRCVITGDNVCAHPLKNGLQRPGQRSPEVLERYDEACKILGVKNKNLVTQ
jgi:hypothetical protein